MTANPPIRATSFVFTITVNWVKLYWTGRAEIDGSLERCTHRADARKFPSMAVALEVADTHKELRDSDDWKIAPLTAGALTK